MYRNGKPTSTRISAQNNIQKTNRPSVVSSLNSSSSGMKKGISSASPSKQSPQPPSLVRISSNPQTSNKSPKNIGMNNIHHHNVDLDKSKSKIEEEEEDDDMEIMSVNDQYQYLRDVNKSKDLHSSIKSGKSSRSSKSNRSNISEMGVSDDSIPLKLKKKVHIETPVEKELRDSLSSSIHSTPIVQDNNNDLESDEEQSVSSSHNSLHILSTVRKKLRDEEEEESVDQQYVNSNPRPSKMAEYIKRFRTAPPTKRSERKRLDIEEPISIPHIERRKKSEPESVVLNSREENRAWMKKVGQNSFDNSHPSMKNIIQMKESIKKEIMDVEDDIELAKRYSRNDFDVEEEEEPQTLSTRDHLSFMDTLDFDINELNNITDLALENGSFKMFGNMENIMSKLSNDNNTNQSKDSISSGKKNDMSDSSLDEEKLDEMFRKSVLSRLQSIGLHESYLDMESYDILSDKHRKEDSTSAEYQVEELIKERNQVEQMIKGIKTRESSNTTEKEEKEKSIQNQDTKDAKSSLPSSSSSNTKESSESSRKSEQEKPVSKYEISIDHEDMEEGFFPVVTIKSDKTPQVSQSMESTDSYNNAFESRQLDFVDEEELLKRQQQNDLTPPIVTESMDSILGKSIESVSSVSSANDLSSMGYCQRMIEQMVSSDDKPMEKKVEVDINDDNNELFTGDYICQTLRQKIDQLKNRLKELEKDALN